MLINILTLFPNMFDGFLGESLIKRGIEDGYLTINIIDIRDYAIGKHKQADDYPFGGGPGMLLKPEPLFKALGELKNSKIIYTSPQGIKLNQNLVKELAIEEEITIIAGHYEGIDERVVDKFVDMEISIGDYVLTGGEIPAMVIVDSLSRMIDGVVKNKDSVIEDSFFDGLLDCPHYTRPAEYEGMKVPDVLLSGHHKKIDEWRVKESLKRTLSRRPDLLEGREFTKEELKILKEIKDEK